MRLILKIAITLLVVGCASLFPGLDVDREAPEHPNAVAAPEATTVYRVAGEEVDLGGGEALVSRPNATGASASTRYRVMAAATGDVNGDGAADRSVVVSVDSGGSGSLYFVAVNVLREGRPVPIDSLLIGDRVELESLRILEPGHVDQGMIIVGLNFRDSNQPMTEAPRFYITRMFRVLDDKLIEIPQY